MFIHQRIAKDEIDNYSELIPVLYHDGIRNGKFFAVLTFDGTAEAEKLVGAVVMGVSHYWAQIRYYWLAPSYDTPDYLSDLIAARITDAMTGGHADGIYTIISGSEKGESDAAVFASQGFEIVRSKSSVLDFTIGGIDATRLAKYRKKNDIVMLKDMDQKMLRVLSNHMAVDGRNVPIEIPVEWDKYDQSLSLVRVEDDVPLGLALVSTDKDMVMIDLVYERDPHGLLSLIAALVSEGREKLSEDTRVRVAVLEERFFDLFHMIAPEAERSSVIKAYLPFHIEPAAGWEIA